MTKPTVGKGIKIGFLISFLGLYTLGLWSGVEPSLAKRRPLSPVDSMFQEMQLTPGKSPVRGTDLSDIAKKYIKINSSKEDVLTFSSNPKAS